MLGIILPNSSNWLKGINKIIVKDLLYNILTQVTVVCEGCS